jgi:Nucleotidyl transferase of unknown function (DUF2204)
MHLNAMPEPPIVKNPDQLPVTSSVPSDLPEEQAALFFQVLTLLEKKKIPYAVSGAIALHQHTGICRSIKDLDLFMTARTASQALPYLQERGLQCEVCDPVWLVKVRRGEFFVDLITGMSNAAIVVEDSWIERAIPGVVHGVKTRILAPEELVASKLFVARRERFDGADIAHILYSTHASFDWERGVSLAGEHWEMLLWSLILFRYVYPDKAHYVPIAIWRRLLRRFENEIGSSRPGARFRGSLVDENMFAIDTNEWGLINLLEESRKQRLAETESLEAPPGHAVPRAS